MPMNLDKDPSSWARMSPLAVIVGSKAQRANVLDMAKHDIAALDQEVQKLRNSLTEIERMAKAETSRKTIAAFARRALSE